MSASATLLGDWRPIELYGRPVDPKRDRNGQLLKLSFSNLSGKWWWSANDGCNSTSGHFRVTADGVFEASSGVSTLVGCPPNFYPRGAQNVKTPQRAHRAWLVPAHGNSPAQLALTSNGEIIGVYEET